MSTSLLAAHPLQVLTMPDTAVEIPKGRFITYAGAICGDNGVALGVSTIECAVGDTPSVTVFGTEVVTAGAAVPLGSPVASDANGKARVALTGENVIGRALSVGATDKDMIIVLNAK